MSRSGIYARQTLTYLYTQQLKTLGINARPTDNNSLFYNKFMNIKQDSRLHGNDGVSYF